MVCAFRSETEPVAFGGIIPSTHVFNSGYFCRVGVLGKHCGHGLQLRLMRAVEARARLNGWCSVISDTTDNMHSANNFIRAGYRLFSPRESLGLVEYALLAQGRKIALIRCVPKSLYPPGGLKPPGHFCVFGTSLAAE